MKATGIVRPLDNLGRIVIPKEVRKTFGISAKDPIEIFVEGEEIILRKFNIGCIICGNGDYQSLSIIDDNKLICKACIEKLTRI